MLKQKALKEKMREIPSYWNCKAYRSVCVCGGGGCSRLEDLDWLVICQSLSSLQSFHALFTQPIGRDRNDRTLLKTRRRG